VLPHRYAATFGDAAVYCAPAEVTDTVRTLYGRRAALRQQSIRGLDFVRDHHGHDRYATGVEALA
jgi:O-antigen biosynthesis protein